MMRAFPSNEGHQQQLDEITTELPQSTFHIKATEMGAWI